VLVLEARRSVEHDEESQLLLLTGECRREDVTEQNTVLSSQLADMTLKVHNEGQVKDSATKGWLTRVFEAVFNF
jgi:flagellar basal body L-ring protein FlgH